MIAPEHDFTGALRRTHYLPNNVVAVDIEGDGEAVRCRLHDRSAFTLRAADVRPSPGQDARAAVEEAIYQACLARQKRRA